MSPPQPSSPSSFVGEETEESFRLHCLSDSNMELIEQHCECMTNYPTRYGAKKKIELTSMFAVDDESYSQCTTASTPLSPATTISSESRSPSINNTLSNLLETSPPTFMIDDDDDDDGDGDNGDIDDHDSAVNDEKVNDTHDESLSSLVDRLRNLALSSPAITTTISTTNNLRNDFELNNERQAKLRHNVTPFHHCQSILPPSPIPRDHSIFNRTIELRCRPSVSFECDNNNNNYQCVLLNDSSRLFDDDVDCDHHEDDYQTATNISIDKSIDENDFASISTISSLSSTLSTISANQSTSENDYPILIQKIESFLPFIYVVIFSVYFYELLLH